MKTVFALLIILPVIALVAFKNSGKNNTPTVIIKGSSIRAGEDSTNVIVATATIINHTDDTIRFQYNACMVPNFTCDNKDLEVCFFHGSDSNCMAINTLLPHGEYNIEQVLKSKLPIKKLKGEKFRLGFLWVYPESETWKTDTLNFNNKDSYVRHMPHIIWSKTKVIWSNNELTIQ